MSAEVPEKNNHHAEPPTDDDTSTTVVVPNSGDDDNKRTDENTSSSISSPSSAAVAKGLSTLLSSVIKDFDSTAESTITSQDQLAFSLDRLTGELDQLLEAAPLPFIMQHATKISSVRRRVTSLNSVLKSIQRRVDNIDRIVSAALLQEKVVARESGGQQ